MLTGPVVDDLIKKLNDQVDIPFIGEETEAKGLRWLVEKVMLQIPDWVIEFMSSAADGLTLEDIKQHSEVIVTEINKLVDIPGTPEFIEAKLIGFVVNGILEYALLGKVAPTE